MLFTTPSQFAVLGLLLFVGWVFGFASHPGGKRWRAAYDEERLGHAQYRDEAEGQLRDVDGRIGALERDNQALERRNAELTAELERARSDRPSTVAPALAGAAVGVVAASAARPAFANPEPALSVKPPERRGWFDWGKSDDLTRLRGVDGEIDAKLKAEKVNTYAELAGLSDQDEIALERRLDLPAGYIQREQWRDQAKLLAAGDTAGHDERFS